MIDVSDKPTVVPSLRRRDVRQRAATHTSETVPSAERRDYGTSVGHVLNRLPKNTVAAPQDGRTATDLLPRMVDEARVNVMPSTNC